MEWVKWVDVEDEISKAYQAGYLKADNGNTIRERFGDSSKLERCNCNLKYCCDCRFIRKPAGAPYIPHPESICLCDTVKTSHFVTNTLYNPLCKDVNHGGLCQYFERI